MKIPLSMILEVSMSEDTKVTHKSVTSTPAPTPSRSFKSTKFVVIPTEATSRYDREVVSYHHEYEYLLNYDSIPLTQKSMS